MVLLARLWLSAALALFIAVFALECSASRNSADFPPVQSIIPKAEQAAATNSGIIALDTSLPVPHSILPSTSAESLERTPCQRVHTLQRIEPAIVQIQPLIQPASFAQLPTDNVQLATGY